MSSKFCWILPFFLGGCTFLPTTKKLPPTAEVKRLEEAAKLEEQGQSQTAEEIYRSVREMTFETHPGLAALAEWRMSFTSEARGEDLKALSHVLSAEKLQNSLPENISLAELPARKAMLFSRLGRNEEALASLAQADRGLQNLLSGTREKPADAWLARLYCEMGGSIALHLTEENFGDYLRAERISQKYLIHAIAQNDPQWSAKALDTVTSHEADFWNFLVNFPADSGMDPRVALRQRRERRIPLLAQFQKLVEESQMLAPVVAAQGNSFQLALAGFQQDLQEKIGQLLYSNSETMMLTEESRLLNGVRRLKKPSSTKKNPHDPNL